LFFLLFCFFSSTYIKIRKTRQLYIHKDKENKTAVHT
jgi:hypothetical protein